MGIQNVFGNSALQQALLRQQQFLTSLQQKQTDFQKYQVQAQSELQQLNLVKTTLDEQLSKSTQEKQRLMLEYRQRAR